MTKTKKRKGNIMVRRGFRSDINAKIDTILSLCNELGLLFDNSIPNRYKLSVRDKETYEFLTYNDVISALCLIKSMKNKE